MNTYRKFVEAYSVVTESKTPKAVKFTTLSNGKPTKVILARSEDDLETKEQKDTFKRVMKSGKTVELGKNQFAEPMTEAALSISRIPYSKKQVRELEIYTDLIIKTIIAKGIPIKGFPQWKFRDINPEYPEAEYKLSSGGQAQILWSENEPEISVSISTGRRNTEGWTASGRTLKKVLKDIQDQISNFDESVVAEATNTGYEDESTSDIVSDYSSRLKSSHSAKYEKELSLMRQELFKRDKKEVTKLLKKSGVVFTLKPVKEAKNGVIYVNNMGSKDADINNLHNTLKKVGIKSSQSAQSHNVILVNKKDTEKAFSVLQNSGYEPTIHESITAESKDTWVVYDKKTGKLLHSRGKTWSKYKTAKKFADDAGGNAEVADDVWYMDNISEAKQTEFTILTSNGKKLSNQISKTSGIELKSDKIRKVKGKDELWITTSMTKDDIKNEFDLVDQITTESKGGKKISSKKMKIKNISDLKHFIVRNYSVTGKDKKDVEELKASDDIMQAKGWSSVKAILNKNYWDEKTLDELYDTLIAFQFEAVTSFFDDLLVFKINEKSDDEITQVLNVVTKSGKPLIQIGDDLEKAFGKKNVSFTTKMFAHYNVKVGGRNIIIINKKYVTKPDAFVGDIAIGEM